MQLLKKRILQDGKCYEGGILKVDGFINHQMDGLKLYKILTSNPITRPDRKYVRKKDRAQMEI